MNFSFRRMELARVKSLSEENSGIIHGFLGYFFQKWGVGVLKFWSWGIKGALKVAGRYKKPSKIQTTWPKWLKYGLKWSQEDSLDDPWCPQTSFFPKIWCRALQIVLIGYLLEIILSHIWAFSKSTWGEQPPRIFLNSLVYVCVYVFIYLCICLCHVSWPH